MGVIEATTATRPKDLEGSISLLGEGGSVEIAGFAVNEIRTWNFAKREPGDDEVSSFSVNPPNVYGFGHQAYLEHVVDCVQNQKAALVDGLEGRKSLELITAIYESIETGREIPLRFEAKRSRLGRGAVGAVLPGNEPSGWHAGPEPGRPPASNPIAESSQGRLAKRPGGTPPRESRPPPSGWRCRRGTGSGRPT